MREVEGRVDLLVERVAAVERVVAVERFAEHEELRLRHGHRRHRLAGIVRIGRIGQRDLAGGELADARREVLPELVLDVLERVDAEAVEVGRLDPAREHRGERRAHVGILRRQIFQAAGEVAGQHLLAHRRSR